MLMLLVETRQLATFVAVARAGSFSRAAAELGYTQSAVSQHIAVLEERSGQRLLERRPVRLTPAGERLRQHAEAILMRLDAATAELRHASVPAGRHVRVGAASLAAPAALAGALARVGGASVHAVERSDALSQLTNGRLDLALLDGYGRAGEPLLLGDAGVLATALIHEQPAAVALPETHPFAAADEIRLADLVDAWWLDAPRLATPLPALRRLVAAPDGFRTRVSYDGEDLTTLLALVAARRGLAILPHEVLAGAARVADRPLAGVALVHRVEAAWLRHGARPVIEALLSALLDEGRS